MNSGGKAMNFAMNGIKSQSLLAIALLALTSACGAEGPMTGETTGKASLATGVAGTWSTVVAPAPFGINPVQLLPDGSVLVGDGGTQWARLVPDSHGSYEHGQWVTAASSHVGRLYNPSTILKDGRYWIGGGEYVSGNDHSTVDIYDPSSDQWQQGPDMPDEIADTAASILPDGRFLCSSAITANTYFFDPTAPIPWSFAGLIPGSSGDERGWSLLQDGTVLDPSANGNVYDPGTNTWSATGPLTESISLGSEVGALSLLYSGKAIQFGAAAASDVGHTQVYDPATRSWSSGPDAPDGHQFGDSPAAVMPNGRVLVSTGDKSDGFEPSAFWEYDPTAPAGGAFISVPYPPGSGTIEALAPLPNGQVLLTYNNSATAYLYTPSGTPDSAWRPTITSLSTASKVGGLTLSGTGLNGLTLGGSFGDDLNLASNFPVVWLTDAAGNVTYARTYGFSQITPNGAASTAKVALPSSLAAGTYTVHVSANGVEASNTTPLTIGSGPSVTALSGPSIGPQGYQINWTVTLSAAAPAGGTIVDLSSDSGAASVPFTVTVPQGATSATFPVRYGVNGIANIYAASRSAQNHVVSAPFGSKVTQFSGAQLPSSGSVVNWQLAVSPTPPGVGLWVNLSTSNPNVATVPSSVLTAADGTATVPVTITGPGSAILAASMPGSAVTAPVGFNVTYVAGPRAPLSGNTANWLVEIDTPVGTQGAIVNLSSSNTAVGTVPATVTIVSGQSASFPVTAVGTGVTTIVASAPGSSTSALFGLDVESVTANPTTIVGVGNTSVGTVRLNGLAPAGGTVVNLRASNGTITVPAQVTIPQGAVQGQFTITAASAPGRGGISATVPHGSLLHWGFVTTTP
jgi:hypothetical protein